MKEDRSYQHEGLVPYHEHPDQAKSKLDLPERIDVLRHSYIDYIGARNIGPKTILSDIEGRIERWVPSGFKKHVSKTLSPANLRDFRRGSSDLIMPSRLLIHVYIWTSHEPYRAAWGDFYVHDAQYAQ